MILHVDGDAFFAAVEVAKNPALRGKPVVVGEEKSIATALTYEAKARGVTRGMPIYQIRKICPEAIILPSDFGAYHLFSRRMYEIVRRYSAHIDEYSIDECFADFSLENLFPHARVLGVEGAARALKAELAHDLGITFTVGLASTKVLAKLASKWEKPDGFTHITPENRPEFLAKTSIGKIWGVGGKTMEKMRAKGIFTALDLVSKPLVWVEEHFAKPYQAMWYELRGNSVYGVGDSPNEIQKSLQRTRTFASPSTDKAYIFSELSKNIEAACRAARSAGVSAGSCSFFLKTQEFTYHGAEAIFLRSTQFPNEIIPHLAPLFEALYVHGVRYRATGATLFRLAEKSPQADLFGESAHASSFKKIFAETDRLAMKYGKHTVMLASSLAALKKRGMHTHKIPVRHLFIPFLGEVR